MKREILKDNFGIARTVYVALIYEGISIYIENQSVANIYVVLAYINVHGSCVYMAPMLGDVS